MLELMDSRVNGTLRREQRKNSCTEEQAAGRVKSLIVNADDLGWTEGVNRGIVDAHRKGLVTSASLLANGEAFEDALRVRSDCPELGIGVHLNLSDGLPTAPAKAVASLLDEGGKLSGGPESLLLRLASRSLKVAEVEAEWDAQIAKVREAGVAPTHLDGHKHVQMLPGLFEAALRLAKRHGIRAIRVSHEASSLRSRLTGGKGQKAGVVLKQGVLARGLKLLARDARKLAERAGIATPDYFCGIAQTGVLTREGVEQLLSSLPEGTTELMCHPGYVDADLQRSATRLQDSRRSELDILTDPGIRKLVATRGIRLINFKLMAETV